MTWRSGPWDLGFSYLFELGDYEDEALSAQRHQLRAHIERTLYREWTIGFETGRRHSRYDLESIGSEDWTELALTLARTLGPRWRLVMRYAYADNDADLPEFTYDRGRVSAGVEALL